MSYAEITFADKNPVKRWLQRRRLDAAIALCATWPLPIERICDFGAGNGELCKSLASAYPQARIICYEPTAALAGEARKNLSGIASVEVWQNLEGVSPATLDLIVCLEVFEHLPPQETAQALGVMRRLLKPGGALVVGVPVEIGLPALYKGLFRMARRYGAFDANVRNVFASLVGSPPKLRPLSNIAAGIAYYFEHMGFDHRSFKKQLCESFTLRQVAAAPYSWLGAALMPEIYFVVENIDPGAIIDSRRLSVAGNAVAAENVADQLQPQQRVVQLH